MAQERLIVRNPLVEWASSVAPTVFTEIAGFVKSIEIIGKRGTVDVKGYADTGGRLEKTDPENSVKMDLFHSRTWSEFSDLLVTELNGDDPTTFRVKYRGAVAVGTANRIFMFRIQLTDIGTIGGAKNVASMMSATFPTEGKVQSSIDGTTFADYF